MYVLHSTDVIESQRCSIHQIKGLFAGLLLQVTYVSNLFDTFFAGGKDHRLPRVSAGHMPYLEGADAAHLTSVWLEHSTQLTRSAAQP